MKASAAAVQLFAMPSQRRAKTRELEESTFAELCARLSRDRLGELLTEA